MIYELFLSSYNILHGLHGPSCWLTDRRCCLLLKWSLDRGRNSSWATWGDTLSDGDTIFFRSDIERGVGSLFPYSIMCNGHLVPLKRKWWEELQWKTIHLKSICLRMKVDWPGKQTNYKLQRLCCYSILLISFSNVCRYLLTMLSKQQLIQLLEYLTSAELLQNVSVQLSKNIKPFMFFFVTKTHKTLVLFKIPC